MNDSPSTIFQVFVGLGGMAGLAAVIRSFWDSRTIKAANKRTDVDTAGGIAELANKQLLFMAEQLESLQEDFHEAQEKSKKDAKEMASLRRQMSEYQAWSAKVMSKLNELGVHDMPLPPQLAEHE